MNRRDWLRNTLAGAAALQASEVGIARDLAADTDLHCGNSLITIRLLRSDSAVWALTELASSRTYRFAPPIFEIDGHPRRAALTGISSSGEPVKLPNGAAEFRYSGIFANDPTLSLELTFRIAPDSPVTRFRYTLHSTTDRTLTASGNTQHLRYLSTSFENLTDIREIRLSVFNDMLHSYTSSESAIERRDFMDSLALWDRFSQERTRQATPL